MTLDEARDIRAQQLQGRPVDPVQAAEAMRVIQTEGAKPTKARCRQRKHPDNRVPKVRVPIFTAAEAWPLIDAALPAPAPRGNPWGVIRP